MLLVHRRKAQIARGIVTTYNLSWKANPTRNQKTLLAAASLASTSDPRPSLLCHARSRHSSFPYARNWHLMRGRAAVSNESWSVNAVPITPQITIQKGASKSMVSGAPYGRIAKGISQHGADSLTRNAS